MTGTVVDPNGALGEIHGEVFDSYIQPPTSGPGFYTFGRRAIQYGDPQVIPELTAFAAQWNVDHPGFEIGIGEMSNSRGQTVSPHHKHLLGLRVDIRPMRIER